MDRTQFFILVRDMRKYQRMYFRSKGTDRAALLYSKDLEKRVDAEIARVELAIKERREPRLDL